MDGGRYVEIEGGGRGHKICESSQGGSEIFIPIYST